jgi:hypothetical protein
VRTGNASVAPCGDRENGTHFEGAVLSFSFPIAIYFKELKANLRNTNVASGVTSDALVPFVTGRLYSPTADVGADIKNRR